MSHPAATEQMAGRVDRLLRSLIGVADLHSAWTASGRLRLVHILKAAVAEDHQIVRNVVSGVRAGFGIELDPADVRVYQDAAAFAAVSAARVPASSEPSPGAATGDGPAAVAAATVLPAGRRSGFSLNGSPPPSSTQAAAGAGRAGAAHLRLTAGQAEASASGGNGAGRVAARSRDNRSGGVAVPKGVTAPLPAPRPASPADTAERPVLWLESVELERQGGALHCRVALHCRGKAYSAVADMPDSPTAEAELAARVTLDALRAGGLSVARLDGIATTVINDRPYVVAAVRDPAGGATRASTAPVRQSIARAAADAVLSAIDAITLQEHRPAEPRLSMI
jgi:hypothetical protein